MKKYTSKLKSWYKENKPKVIALLMWISTFIIWAVMLAVAHKLHI